MRPDKKEIDSLQELITALTDGELSDELVVSLERTLETSAEARRLYRHQIEVHATLLFGFPPASDPLPQIDSAESFAEYVQKAGIHSQEPERLEDSAFTRALASFESVLRGTPGETPAADARSTIIRYDQPLSDVSAPYLPAWRSFAYVGAALLLLGSILFGSHRLYQEYFGAREMAMEFDEGQSHPSLMNGGVVRVETGTTRLRLPGVGFMVVDGPAEMELVNPMRIRLDEGRIRVRVTEPSGHGFVVVTPHGEVTDLGTEFSVDVTDVTATELVVFEGEVDLRMTTASINAPAVRRITGGEGVRFGRSGTLDRIMSINTRQVADFQPAMRETKEETQPVILNVSDDIRPRGTMLYYGIVHGGMEEDALAFVDRPYEWNGLDESGIPSFLLGADYVQTFNGYKSKPFKITLELGRPADVYILWDMRVPPASWLQRDFQKTELEIGLDVLTNKYFRRKGTALGRGPGKEVDYPFSIWHKRVFSAQSVKLGALNQNSFDACTYGIAAVALDATQETPTQVLNSKR